jgi:hypothetical protein
MGQRTRDNTRNFFSLDFLTGNNARREAAQNEQRATDLWMGEWDNLPGSGYYDIQENEVYADPSAHIGLNNNADYRLSQQQQRSGQEAQLQALRQMQGIAGAGGYTGLERDQIAQAQRQAAQAEKSQRDAVVQQMQMRGMGGGGADLAARLQAQQGAANQGRADATNIATQAQMRALQAMQGGAQIGANQQSAANAQQTVAGNRAAAIDAFNQANTNRQQGVAQRNAANTTAARVQATQDRQNILAGATGQYNGNAGNAAQRARDQQGLLTSIIGAVA